jgi:hypothetical protein
LYLCTSATNKNVVKNGQSDDGKTATTYKTESQLFSKKCAIKLPKHANHTAGKSSNFLKNGQDLQRRKSRKIKLFDCQKEVVVKLKTLMKKISFLLPVALLAVCTVFVSCNKEDNSSGSLVGKWYCEEEGVIFTFTADQTWNAHREDDDNDRYDDNGTYVYDKKEETINLTYIPEIGEPIWGRSWTLRKKISSTLEVDVYDDQGYEGVMTLTKQKK